MLPGCVIHQCQFTKTSFLIVCPYLSIKPVDIAHLVFNGCLSTKECTSTNVRSYVQCWVLKKGANFCGVGSNIVVKMGNIVRSPFCLKGLVESRITIVSFIWADRWIAWSLTYDIIFYSNIVSLFSVFN